MNKRRLILFARYPVPGRVKTRLIPALGTEGATALHRRLVLRTLRTANAACQAVNAELEVCFDGGSETAMRHWLGKWRFSPQGEGDLGQRMAASFQNSLQNGSSETILIGSDCPGLTPNLLVTAFDQLSQNPVVFGPANDGGYYLIGLTRMIPELFCGIHWGTETVLADSLRILGGQRSVVAQAVVPRSVAAQKSTERFPPGRLKPALLPALDDLDRPEDLSNWRRLIEAEETTGHVSVIIPALNEANHIARTLESVQQCDHCNVIVVDGSSSDETKQLALEAGACVITLPPGRSGQMNAGAALAAAHSILFLHADTLLPSNWTEVIDKTLQRPQVAAGAFSFRIAGNFAGKWIVESTTHLRSKWFQLPYGDQALFIKRSLFEELGGFADMPIMEDYEFVQRLRQRGRIVTAPEPVLTSNRRWRRLGFLRTTWINKLVLAGYHFGMSPHKLARLYRGHP